MLARGARRRCRRIDDAPACVLDVDRHLARGAGQVVGPIRRAVSQIGLIGFDDRIFAEIGEGRPGWGRLVLADKALQLFVGANLLLDLAELHQLLRELC